jgi:hypothetical protein
LEAKGYLKDLEHSQWRAPSWSWVSTDFSGGSVRFFNLDTNLVEVVEAVVKRAGKDPNGEVASGFLQLRAKALNASAELLHEADSRDVVKISIDAMIITGPSGGFPRTHAITELLNSHSNRMTSCQVQRTMVLPIVKNTEAIYTRHLSDK